MRRILAPLALVIAALAPVYAQAPPRTPDVILKEVQTLVDELKALFPAPPPAEVCGDGLDNDGDGQVDEGCAPSPPAAVIVSTSAELTAALKVGGSIRLKPGTYTGNFAVTQPTVIDRFDPSALPTGRISPADVADTVLVASDPYNPTLQVSASDVVVRGITVTGVAPDRVTVLVGFKPAATDPVTVLPSRVSIDRIVVLGTNGLGHRGVEMHGADMQFTRNYVAGILEQGRQSQGFWAAYGPGPYLIEDNYIEASGENILFGGDDPPTPGLVPSDIVIRRNLLYKLPAWRQKPGSVANLLELKNAQRVLIEDNILDGSWTDIQIGHGAVFTPRNQYGKAPWCTVRDVRFVRNVVRNYDTFALSHLYTDNNHQSGTLANMYYEGNLFLGRAVLNQTGGVDGDLAFIRNTYPLVTDKIIGFNGPAPPPGAGAPGRPNLVWTLNVGRSGRNGIIGQYGGGQGSPSIAAYTTPVTLTGNVVEQGTGTTYYWQRLPSGNLYLNTPGGLAPLLDADYHYLPGGAGY